MFGWPIATQVDAAHTTGQVVSTAGNGTSVQHLTALGGVAAAIVTPPTFLSRPEEEGRSMEKTSNDAALEVLKEQGFEIGESTLQNGHARIWILSRDRSALAEIGRSSNRISGRAVLPAILLHTKWPVRSDYSETGQPGGRRQAGAE